MVERELGKVPASATANTGKELVLARAPRFSPDFKHDQCMTSTGNGFEALKIVSVDRMADGLLVTFSEGTVAMFHTQFLYDVRHDDNNVVVLEQGKPNTPSL